MPRFVLLKAVWNCDSCRAIPYRPCMSSVSRHILSPLEMLDMVTLLSYFLLVYSVDRKRVSVAVSSAFTIKMFRI